MDASIHLLTVFESVNGLFFFMHVARIETAVSLS